MRILSVLFCICFARVVSCNNLHLYIESYDIAINQLELKVKWDNGWNLEGIPASPQNHDAVWLFFKSATVDALPEHLSILSCQVLDNNSHFQLSLPTDAAGIFLYPAVGRSFQSDSAVLVLTFKQRITDNVALSAYAIEMVYVPIGAYYLGDGISNNCFADTSGKPIQIHSSTSSLSYGSTHYTIAADFPTGYLPFFITKYELSQVQYCDFLNSLPDVIARNRISDEGFGKAGTRNGIVYKPENNFGTRFLINNNGLGQYRACNFLSWSDVLAYLDWAALRPITEMEYEKAARGPAYPKPRELAWGTICLTQNTSLRDDGLESEGGGTVLTQDSCGPVISSLPFGQTYLEGPVRQGYAATSTSGRISAGCSYYGAFELAGNLWELCVRADASCFTSQPGDGSLGADGATNQSCWANAPALQRGGGWNSLAFNNVLYPFRDLAISDRFYLSLDIAERRNTYGGRGGR